MKRNNIATEAPATQAPARPTVAPAVSWRTPLQLMGLRLLAVILVLVTVIGAGGLGWAYLETEQLPWALGAAALALIGAVAVLYLWRYTDNVEASTWIIEAATGRDLDGDGLVGPPPQRRLRLVPVSANGKQAEPVAWLEEEIDEPVLLDGFELEAGDLAAWISEAWRRGLSRSAWLTQPRWSFPSGRDITRADWERITTEAERLGWTRRTNSGAEFAIRRIDILRELEALQ